MKIKFHTEGQHITVECGNQKEIYHVDEVLCAMNKQEIHETMKEFANCPWVSWYEVAKQYMEKYNDNHRNSKD